MRTSYLFTLFERFLIPLVWERSIYKVMDNFRYVSSWSMEHRTVTKKSIFNNVSDVVLILLAYIGLVKFGWQFTLITSL